jgi:glycerol-3-phosphate dehydrogenase (NAD(P)+)
MTKQFKVLILGYGEMGRAMEYLLKERWQLDIWEKYPRDDFQSVVLEDAASRADIVLFCLPVNPHCEIIKQIAPILKKTCLCVSIAKGLDEAGQTAAQIFANNFVSHQAYALLYGPMISEEIRTGRYAFAQLGCDDANTDSYHKIRDCFNGTRLYLEYTSDIIGISWSVILKNVYAMVFGMADELQLGDNMRGYLSVAALRELDQVVRQMGGQAGSPYHLAGLGDLITTATSEDSHHHELGRMLARGETSDIEGEGPHTLKMISQHQLLNIADYPLFQLIANIVKQPQNVHKRIDEYLKQDYFCPIISLSKF